MNHVNKVRRRKQKNDKVKKSFILKAINSYEIIDTITIILETEYEVVEFERNKNEVKIVQ